MYKPHRKIRTFALNGPCLPRLSDGGPLLELSGVSGEEELSKIYQYVLQMRTSSDAELTADEAANLNLLDLIGQEVTVTVQLDGMGTFVPGMAGRRGTSNIGQGTREISGIITQASFIGQTGRHSRYRFLMQPWIVLADKRSDYRIFQNRSVVEIIQEVLGEGYMYSYDLRLSRSYPRLTYQVQYGESDFRYIQRLMEEHGIYWFFEHSNGVHRMVLVDQLGAHKPVDSEAYHTLWYHPPGHKIDREYIDTFDATARIQTGTWTTSDFDFRKPRADLSARNELTQDTRHNTFERYEWPGDYTERTDGEQFARIRMEELRAQGERASGSGHIRNIVCGTTFVLAGFPQARANREYLVIRSRLEAFEVGEASGQDAYQVHSRFEVQPATTVFRPPRTTGKPRTSGPQTAIVTGYRGSEIWTDQYGRVTLKFHWDRSPVNDQNSSCWVRVSYPWAGSNFGGINIPRVGTEVIVDFENGDPDRPIVIGRTYNAMTMPPWDLPANATQSGVLSRSMKGGYEKANAIRFEDRDGAEELWLQAERDMRTEAENDASHTVGHDRTKAVGNDESVTIGHDRIEKVGRGEQVDIGEDRRHTIGQDDFLTVGRNHKLYVGKDRIEEIGNHRKDTIAANYQINTGGHVEYMVQGHHQIEAGGKIGRRTRIYELKVGESAALVGPAGKIIFDGNGITLEAVRITMKGPVQTDTGWVRNAEHLRPAVNEGDALTPDNFVFSG